MNQEIVTVSTVLTFQQITKYTIKIVNWQRIFSFYYKYMSSSTYYYQCKNNKLYINKNHPSICTHNEDNTSFKIVIQCTSNTQHVFLDKYLILI